MRYNHMCSPRTWSWSGGTSCGCAEALRNSSSTIQLRMHANEGHARVRLDGVASCRTPVQYTFYGHTGSTYVQPLPNEDASIQSLSVAVKRPVQYIAVHRTVHCTEQYTVQYTVQYSAVHIPSSHIEHPWGSTHTHSCSTHIPVRAPVYIPIHVVHTHRPMQYTHTCKRPPIARCSSCMSRTIDARSTAGERASTRVTGLFPRYMEPDSLTRLRIEVHCTALRYTVLH